MNLVFLALLDSFVSFFRDEVFSNVYTSEFAGRNVRDLLNSYFEENPIVSSDSVVPITDFNAVKPSGVPSAPSTYIVTSAF